MDKEYVRTKASTETETEKIRKGDTLDYYNEDLSLKAVGKLFEEKTASSRGELKKSVEPDIDYEFLNLDRDKNSKKVHERYASRVSSVQDEPRTKRILAPKKTDALYADDYDDIDDIDDESDSPPLKLVVPVIGIIFLVILLFLIYKVNSATNQLRQAEESVDKYTQLNQDYNALKIENEALQTQVASLQAQLASNIEHSPVQSEVSNGESVTAQNNSGEASQSSEYTLYTVVQGDSLSKISQKFYGTQGQYQKIKDYNGMTSDNVAIGQVLRIPN